MVNYKNIVIVFQNFDKIDSFENFIKIFPSIFGGSVFYGGLLGSLLAGFIAIKFKPDFKKYLDIVAVNIPLFHFFGRIGCFLGGCCFGIESRFGFTYTRSPLEIANHVNRFPVQLLEETFNLGLFFVLRYLYKKEKFPNKMLYVYLVMYAAGRFFLEFLRGDTHRGIWLFLSTSQLISILIFATVMITQFVLPRKKPVAAHS